MRAVAMFDFSDDDGQMLSFKEGTELVILEKAPDGEWGRGLAPGGRSGWFPLS
jgi:hypothetical protein